MSNAQRAQLIDTDNIDVDGLWLDGRFIASIGQVERQGYNIGTLLNVSQAKLIAVAEKIERHYRRPAQRVPRRYRPKK